MDRKWMLEQEQGYPQRIPLLMNFTLWVYTRLYSREIRNKNINICTDSQACLKALKSHSFTSRLMIECLKRVTEISETNNVSLVWVPGHRDIEGNEKADKLARDGSLTPFLGPEPAFGLSYRVQKTIIRDYFSDKFTTVWKNLGTCRHSKLFLKGPDSKTTRYLLNCTRTSLRELIGTITGHCKLNKHMNRLGLVVTSACRRCNDGDETPAHLFMDCPALVLDRLKLFGTPFPQSMKDFKISQVHIFAKKHF